jgi:5-methylcytosine-specific restriction endonuclease McrA
MLKKVKRIKLAKQVYRRLMKRVLERDGWRCKKCGSLENLQIHHQIKRSQQGDDTLGNLVTLCAYCHLAEHGQLYFEPRAIQVAAKPQARGRRRAQSDESM